MRMMEIQEYKKKKAEGKKEMEAVGAGKGGKEATQTQGQQAETIDKKEGKKEESLVKENAEPVMEIQKSKEEITSPTRIMTHLFNNSIPTIIIRSVGHSRRCSIDLSH